MKWNKCFNKIKEIKEEYEKEYNDGVLNVEEWVRKLNIDEYTDFASHLQFNHSNEFVLIRYGIAEMQRGMWTDPESVYRHCRSTVIDLQNMELVLHPFTKFFNLNEVEETSEKNIIKALKTAKVVEIADKKDGSMFSAREYRGKIFTSTSMALDERNSWRLTDANRMLKECKGTQKMIHDNKEYTFVFEYISVKDAHVVIYTGDQEGIYLIGVTDMRDGKELNYCDIVDIAKRYGVKSTYTEDIKFEKLIDKSQEILAHEKEGWVINIDGNRFKIKGDDYVKMHRVIDSISSVNVIIEALAEDKYDDLVSKLPEAYKGRVIKVAEEILVWADETRGEIERLYDIAPKETTKEFMIWVDKNVPRELKGRVRERYKGMDYSVLKNRVGSYVKSKDIFGKSAEELMREEL